MSVFYICIVFLLSFCAYQMGAKEALKKYNNVMSKIFDEISDRVDEKNLDIIKDVVNKYAKFLQGN